MLVRQHEKDKQKTCLRQTEFFVERMEAVLDVSNAMGYLHEKNIIFRDLKPENVGFYNDSYVLFDFGLARELKESDRMGFGEDSYRATGLTGSRLFMSPEVAMKKPYGFSADVYSFAILFWEVVALKEVFSNMTMSKHYNQVIVKGKRPSSMEDVLPHELDDMMVASWDKNPTNRPSFESISKTLVQELDKIRNKKFKNGSESMKSHISFSNNSGSSANSKEFGLNARWDDFGTPISRSCTEKRVTKMNKKLQLPLPHSYEKGSNRESKMNQTKIWDSLRKIKDKKANKKSVLSSTNHEKGRMSKVIALLESPKRIRMSKSHPIMFRSSVTRILYGGKDQVTRDDKA
jgi:serine/threonine protein kinase